jgi:thiol:disulfide interchange protein DsbD
MPCVFPVLSIKLLGLLETPASKRVHEAIAYTAGVLATFAALGGLLLLLRSTGSAIGWGFQLQSAPVILGLIALFWLMALSFSGVFEFGNRLMTMAGDQRGGAFVTGILAVFVATPCTGPFMGVALGAAAVMPAASAMAIFLGLGAGLAAPFVLLCLSPPLLNRLPKPGAWMETLRQFLAFPLYLTVIWLLWVLGRLMGDTGWLIGSLLMLTLVFVIWLGRSQNRARRWTAGGIALVALVLAFTSAKSFKPSSAQTIASASAWQSFDSTIIQQARADGQAVFVDYTAAWCITCQVNKKLVLDTEPVQALFKENNVLLVRADWTHHDPAITQALETLGRNSLPVYAWYAAGTNQVELLPQILQKRMIRNLFE